MYSSSVGHDRLSRQNRSSPCPRCSSSSSSRMSVVWLARSVQLTRDQPYQIRILAFPLYRTSLTSLQFQQFLDRLEVDVVGRVDGLGNPVDRMSDGRASAQFRVVFDVVHPDTLGQRYAMVREGGGGGGEMVKGEGIPIQLGGDECVDANSQQARIVQHPHHLSNDLQILIRHFEP